jgi:hypothetical protein
MDCSITIQIDNFQTSSKQLSAQANSNQLGRLSSIVLMLETQSSGLRRVLALSYAQELLGHLEEMPTSKIHEESLH